MYFWVYLLYEKTILDVRRTRVERELAIVTSYKEILNYSYD